MLLDIFHKIRIIETFNLKFMQNSEMIEILKLNEKHEIHVFFMFLASLQAYFTLNCILDMININIIGLLAN
jgi:hypothetical protein